MDDGQGARAERGVAQSTPRGNPHAAIHAGLARGHMRCSSRQRGTLVPHGTDSPMPALRLACVTETYPPEVNGVSLTISRAVEFLRARGHAVQLIRPRQPHEAARDDAEEWRSHGLPIPMYPDLRFGLALASTLRERFARTRPQVVHVVTQGPLGRAAIKAARDLGLPVTSDFRTNFHWYSRYYGIGWLEPLVGRYLRAFHAQADCTFVPTRALAARLGREGFERLEVQGRGVDTERFAPARRCESLRAAWGVAPGDDGLALLYVGRLAAEKNVRLALQAFAAVQRICPEAVMVVVGDGPQRGRLEAEFPQARFVGAQRGEALARHYASADLFLFPSESETFGNVTLEALASGLGVIAFDAAAAAEHVRHGVNGLLVAPGDAAGFVRAACRAAAHPRRLQRMGAQARISALALQWDAVLARFEARLAGYAAGKTRLGAADVVLA
jgi:glycosyltransferase involved in cell wall biosynthesis